MKNIYKILAIALMLGIAGTANAQTVFKTNQIIPTPLSGVIMSTTDGRATLNASSSPTLTSLNTSSTTATSSFRGPLLLDSGSGASDNARLWLISNQEWTSPTHLGDLIRIQPMNDFWKAAISFLDKNGINKTSIVTHDFLSSYNASLDKTFTAADINGTTDVITLSSHGWSTGDQVWFGVSTFLNSNMPDGLFPLVRYYIRAIDSNTVAIYKNSTDATNDTNRLPLDNANGSATFTITKNNWHHHTSIESSDRSGTLGSDGTLHSRVLYTWDYYPMINRIVDTEVQISGQNLVMVSEPGVSQQITYGVGSDRASRRFALQIQGATGEFRGVFYTPTGLSPDAWLRVSSTTGFVGILAAPNSTDALNVGGSLNTSGSITSLGTNITLDSAGTATFGIDRAATSNFSSMVYRTNGTDQWTIGTRNDATNDFHFRDSVNGRTPFFIKQSTGHVGIGTTTPTTQLQVTATAANATSTLTVGKVGQNKGSCLELFDSAGTAVYAYVAAGATTFTLSATSCK